MLFSCCLRSSYYCQFCCCDCFLLGNHRYCPIFATATVEANLSETSNNDSIFHEMQFNITSSVIYCKIKLNISLRLIFLRFHFRRIIFLIFFPLRIDFLIFFPHLSRCCARNIEMNAFITETAGIRVNTNSLLFFFFFSRNNCSAGDA